MRAAVPSAAETIAPRRPADAPRWYVGVDGGATRCRARLRDAVGAVLAEAEGDAANIHVDFASAVSVMRSVVGEACARPASAPAQRPRRGRPRTCRAQRRGRRRECRRGVPGLCACPRRQRRDDRLHRRACRRRRRPRHRRHRLGGDRARRRRGDHRRRPRLRARRRRLGRAYRARRAARRDAAPSTVSGRGRS